MAVKANITIFEPLSIRTNAPKTVFEDYRYEFAVKIVEAVIHCIKFGKSKTVFAEIIIPKSKEIVCLNVEETSFLENLEKNLDLLIELEEYELCAELVKAKEKIINGLPKKTARKRKKEAVDDLIGTIKNL
jgi:hypothetical protein